MGRRIFRSYTFWLCVCAGLGGIAPDIGHFVAAIVHDLKNLLTPLLV